MPDKEITKQDIEKSMEDWKNRISSLYDLITAWIKLIDDNYELKRNSTVLMHEELMQIFLIKPINLEVLNIYYHNHIIVAIKPVGLWIVGANGRLDILYKNGSIILIDRAKRFQNPEWVAFSPNNKSDGKEFNKGYFTDFLRNCI